MWSRKSTDPLGRLLFDRYGLHVLSRPREDVAVFDVFPVSKGRSSAPGRLTTLLGGRLKLPAVREEERLGDVSGTTSQGVSGALGFKFVEGFLGFIGGPGLVMKLSAAFERTRTRSLRFRFGGATRNYVRDPFALDLRLRRHPFVPEDAPMKKEYTYYVATAVHVSEQVSLTALDERSTKIDFAAEVKTLGGAEAGLEVSGSGEVTAKCERRLAYGVELSQISYNERSKQLELAMTKGYVRLRGIRAGKLPGSARSMIGDPNDLMVLEVVDEG